MSPFRLTYPIAAEVGAALERFPAIAHSLALPGSGRSELEIVRLLGNTHYTHIDTLLGRIEKELEESVELAAHVLKQRDPFQFNESLAELFLFSHLRQRLANGVRPAASLRASDKKPEMEVAWPS